MESLAGETDLDQRRSLEGKFWVESGGAELFAGAVNVLPQCRQIWQLEIEKGRVEPGFAARESAPLLYHNVASPSPKHRGRTDDPSNLLMRTELRVSGCERRGTVVRRERFSVGCPPAYRCRQIWQLEIEKGRAEPGLAARESALLLYHNGAAPVRCRHHRQREAHVPGRRSGQPVESYRVMRFVPSRPGPGRLA